VTYSEEDTLRFAPSEKIAGNVAERSRAVETGSNGIARAATVSRQLANDVNGVAFAREVGGQLKQATPRLQELSQNLSR
jgi:hypothetical protein